MDAAERQAAIAMLRRAATNPLAHFVPNGAQEHWIKMIGCHDDEQPIEIRTKGYKNHGLTLKSRNKVLSAANKIGKSTGTINILGNLIYGPQNKFFDLPLFRDWPYPKKIWLLSEDSTLVDIIIPEIHRWFPSDRYSTLSKGKKLEYLWSFDTGWKMIIKTYDQMGGKMESDLIGLAVFSEPCEKDLWDAMPARMPAGGLRMMELTPVQKADSRPCFWLYDLRDVDMMHGQIEENCEERGQRGLLKRKDVDWVVSQYDSDEREARAKGRYTIAGGLIWANLMERDIIIKPHKLDKDVLYTFEIDPHESRPPACNWTALFPNGRQEVMFEYPQYQEGLGLEELDRYDLTIKELCAEILAIEKRLGIDGKVIDRIMDPFFGSKEYAQTRQSVQMEYAKYGIICRLPERYYVDVGIDAVKQQLKDGKLKVWDTCINTIRFMQRWHKKKSKEGNKLILDTKWKDYCDLRRYRATAGVKWTPMAGQLGKISWRQKIKKARSTKNVPANFMGV
jgi:hypothetical protein